ncbi:protein nutcracker-like [Teleopsis dalmanni]|uniref:protein nutcracker-like n=2 Tax=Teleopsis dalmanni TaxID=139649 RepID=UPI000D32A725|nr:protein nutcracker-like [Teleopsis dalmanni]
MGNKTNALSDTVDNDENPQDQAVDKDIGGSPESPGEKKKLDDATKSVKNESEASNREIQISTDCMLLQDLNVKTTPIVLKRFMDHMKDKDYTNQELFFILAYIVALECGFVTEEEYERCKNSLQHNSTVSSYHSKNVLTISRLSPTYSFVPNKCFFQMNLYSIFGVDTKSGCGRALLSSFNGYTTGEFMILTVSPDHAIKSEGYSICLSVERYVMNCSRDRPIFNRFARLEEFATTLRDKLFVPIRNGQIQLLELCCHPSILGLPNEIYADIIKHFSDRELRYLAKSNKHLGNIVNDYKKRKQKKKNVCILTKKESSESSNLYADDDYT